MPIRFEPSCRQFRLRAGGTDYIMAVAPGGYLAHVYFGEAVPDEDLTALLRLDENPFTPETNDRDRAVYLDTLPLEYPCYGIGDFREPAFKIRAADGTSACDLRYVSHRITEGKPEIPGLPATFPAKDSPCDTLEILLADQKTGLEVTLCYTAFRELDAIARSVRVKNNGSEKCTLTRVYSAAFDLDRSDLHMITLNGSWARERMVERCRLHHGKQSVDSMRGCSSHQYSPFAALCEPCADEERGEVFGSCFVYSGNFTILAEVTQHDAVRFVMGINDADFSWELSSGEEFCAPEAVLVRSSNGIGGMSRTFHDLFRKNLIRSQYVDRPRPVLINNWEATYFDFDEEKLLSIAREASSLGIEMLVMDDGWFGHRDDDNSSLGDWTVYEKKLPSGLGSLSEKLRAMGMELGIWFEPEMISPDSELYRLHPDWAVQISGRPMTLCRGQYVLDLTRREIADHVWEMMRRVLDSAEISYVKWDMNRQITEAASQGLPAGRQGEFWHRYILAVYELMERLVSRYPELLLETCAGGGGRFDAGMLYYSPQIWCSDDTDAIERLRIQYGTSLCFPCSAIGAHVSDCPNHTVGRSTPFSTRGHAALAGTFGYELDVTRISAEDRVQIPGQISDYRKYGGLVRSGDLYRIGDPFTDGQWDGWIFAAKDGSQALFAYFQILGRPNRRSRRVKLRGLDPKAYYFEESSPERRFSGAYLMNCGINIGGLWGDFQSRLYHFIKCKG
ncbi:MAG: alpha-galactosidase [Ruminococcus sp.]|nr:alpha-galactosidase [Ruminococcus sp.]